MTKSRQFLSSLARGLSVLEAFTVDRRSLSLTEISRLTHISKGGAQRITYTLMELGYLARDDDKIFRLGPKAFSIGFTVLRSLEVRTMAYPYMKELSNKLGFTVNLSVLDDTQIVIIERIETKKVVDLNLQIGTRLPAYCTAAGKAILAFLPPERREEIIDGIEMDKITQYTISEKRALSENLKETKRRGYSLNNQELSLSSRTVGAPIFSNDGRVIAAVSTGDNSGLQTKEEFEQTCAPLIVELSRKISGLLGWSTTRDFTLPC